MHHLKEEMEVLVRELKCNNSVIERSASCLNVPSVLCHITASEDV